MNIWIYSDESGVFDKAHNEYFVYGGVVFFDKDTKDVCNRKYLHAERSIRENCRKYSGKELKACLIESKHKAKLFRSLNEYIKFGIVINQQKILDRIFTGKKDKQRYLDYAYKIGIKRLFLNMIDEGRLNPLDIDNLLFFVDEHTTATNGHYELKDGLEEEFKRGTYNFCYNKFYPPIFPEMRGGVSLNFCNSNNSPLIRASDIVANQVYYRTVNRSLHEIDDKVFITKLP